MAVRTVKPNEKSIKALLPERIRYRIGVESVPGLFVDVTPSGSKAYYLRYRHQGKSRWMRIAGVEDGRLGHVLDRAREVVASVKIDRVDVAAERKASVSVSSFAALFNDWLEKHAKPNKKSWSSDEGLFKRHIDHRIGSRPALELTRREIAAALDDITREISPTQSRACKAIISVVFSWAEDRGIIENHPARGLKQAKKPSARQRVMTEDEIRSFWHGIEALPRGEGVRRALKLFLLTGKRLSEVVGARKSELHLDAEEPMWIIPGGRVKNGQTDRVPLASLTAATFRDAVQAAGSSGYVFPARTGASRFEHVDPQAVSRRRLGLMRSLAIDDCTTHDLRRTMASQLAKMGIAHEVRRELLNHKPATGNVTDGIYNAHEYEREKRAALEAWEKRLLEIIEGRAV